MPIRKIRITNFKSFDHLEINLENFNVLIGANASGKSNFVKIFEFLKDIQNHGLENAISLQGGVEYLRNMNLEASRDFTFNIVSDEKFGMIGHEANNGYIGVQIYESEYNFSLSFIGKKGSKISQDNMNLKCRFVKLEEHYRKLKEEETLGKGQELAAI